MASTQRLTLRPLATAARPTTTSRTATAAARLPTAPVRRKSGPYGYTQAKALVFPKYGEPSDVLQ